MALKGAIADTGPLPPYAGHHCAPTTTQIMAPFSFHSNIVRFSHLVNWARDSLSGNEGKDGMFKNN